MAWGAIDAGVQLWSLLCRLRSIAENAGGVYSIIYICLFIITTESMSLVAVLELKYTPYVPTE